MSEDEIDEYGEDLRSAPAGPLLGRGPFRKFIREKKDESVSSQSVNLSCDATLLALYEERAAQMGVPARELIERALRRWLNEEALIEKFEELILERRGSRDDESAA